VRRSIVWSFAARLPVAGGPAGASAVGPTVPANPRAGFNQYGVSPAPMTKGEVGAEIPFTVAPP